MAPKRSGKEALPEDLLQRGKHRQRITEYNSKITSNGIGIKFLSLNLYILVGTLILECAGN